jgi:hypothetical protein
VIDFNREIGVFMIFTHGFRDRISVLRWAARLDEDMPFFHK